MNDADRARSRKVRGDLSEREFVGCACNADESAQAYVAVFI